MSRDPGNPSRPEAAEEFGAEPATSDLVAVRRGKLAEMRAAGADPFQANWSVSHISEEARALYHPPAEGGDEAALNTEEVRVAGRVVAINRMGKASFVRIQDSMGRLQLYFRKEVLGEEAYDAFKKQLDLGDIIGARGPLFATRTGEITVRALEFRIVAKALRPLPEKWHGLQDSDQVYRQRYLDLIVNSGSRERFRTRSRIIAYIRRFLEERRFLEVETPVLQGEAGGAAARPFITHFNALDCDFYLRIALELHLKRLLVGGFDRVFELGRVFRNEGLSRKHNPEFTMLELYQAYSDYQGMMELLQSLIQGIGREVLGTLQIEQPSGEVIDLSGDWRVARYKDLIRENTGDPDWFERSRTEKLAACARMGIEVNPQLEEFEITNDVFEKRIEPSLLQPTFVTHLPRQLIPLAKLSPDDPETVEVFEFCVNGQELAPAYSEQNDPDAQRAMLESQAGEETQKIDEDFLLSLEHGMPPAGGMGVGIDRLVILLTGATNIRDTILFPSLRPGGRKQPPIPSLPTVDR